MLQRSVSVESLRPIHFPSNFIGTLVQYLESLNRFEPEFLRYIVSPKLIKNPANHGKFTGRLFFQLAIPANGNDQAESEFKTLAQNIENTFKTSNELKGVISQFRNRLMQIPPYIKLSSTWLCTKLCYDVSEQLSNDPRWLAFCETLKSQGYQQDHLQMLKDQIGAAIAFKLLTCNQRQISHNHQKILGDFLTYAPSPRATLTKPEQKAKDKIWKSARPENLITAIQEDDQIKFTQALQSLRTKLDELHSKMSVNEDSIYTRADFIFLGRKARNLILTSLQDYVRQVSNLKTKNEKMKKTALKQLATIILEYLIKHFPEKKLKRYVLAARINLSSPVEDTASEPELTNVDERSKDELLKDSVKFARFVSRLMQTEAKSDAAETVSLLNSLDQLCQSLASILGLEDTRKETKDRKTEKTKKSSKESTTASEPKLDPAAIRTYIMTVGINRILSQHPQAVDANERSGSVTLSGSDGSVIDVIRNWESRRFTNQTPDDAAVSPSTLTESTVATSGGIGASMPMHPFALTASTGSLGSSASLFPLSPAARASTDNDSEHEKEKEQEEKNGATEYTSIIGGRVTRNKIEKETQEKSPGISRKIS